MRGKQQPACSVVSHWNFHMAPAVWKSKWKAEQRKELCLENYLFLVDSGWASCGSTASMKEPSRPKKLWLTSPPSCLGCRVWDAGGKEHCHLVWGKSRKKLQAGWLCKCGQQTVLCLFMLSCFFVDVSVLRSFLLHASPIAFCFLTAGKAQLIHMSWQKIQPSLW